MLRGRVGLDGIGRDIGLVGGILRIMMAVFVARGESLCFGSKNEHIAVQLQMHS